MSREKQSRINKEGKIELDTAWEEFRHEWDTISEAIDLMAECYPSSRRPMNTRDLRRMERHADDIVEHANNLRRKLTGQIELRGKRS